jgi:hypothetical protein
MGNCANSPLTMSRVDAPPFLMTEIRTPRSPPVQARDALYTSCVKLTSCDSPPYRPRFRKV